MAFKIIDQKEEPLLSRTKVQAELDFEQATPSKAEVAKQIASALKKEEKLVVIKKIDTHYGSRHADVDAVVYDSEESKEKTEVKTKKQREAEKKAAEEAAKKAEEEKAAAEKPAEEKPVEEAPKEEAATAETPAEPAKEEKTEEKKE